MRGGMLSLVLLGGLLLFSWHWPVTRAVWDLADRWVFFTLNGSLPGRPEWQYFWAVLNSRPYDAFLGVLLIGLSYAHVRGSAPNRQAAAAAQVLCTLLLAIAAIQLSHLLLEDDRDSASLVLSPSYRLSELVPTIHAKDASGTSFPSDHGTLVFSVLGLFACCARRRLLLACLPVVLIALLPRLLGGAHWFSDVAVGSASVALIWLGLAHGTPLFARLTDRLTPAMDWLLHRLPGLRWWLPTLPLWLCLTLPLPAFAREDAAPKLKIQRNVDCARLKVTPDRLKVDFDTEVARRRNSQGEFRADAVMTVTPNLPDDVILRADFTLTLLWNKRVPRRMPVTGSLNFYGTDDKPQTHSFRYNSVYAIERVDWKLTCDRMVAEKPKAAAQPTAQPPAAKTRLGPADIAPKPGVTEGDVPPAALDAEPLFHDRPAPSPTRQEAPPLVLDEPQVAPQIRPDGTVVFPKLEVHLQEAAPPVDKPDGWLEIPEPTPDDPAPWLD